MFLPMMIKLQHVTPPVDTPSLLWVIKELCTPRPIPLTTSFSSFPTMFVVFKEPKACKQTSGYAIHNWYKYWCNVALQQASQYSKLL